MAGLINYPDLDSKIDNLNSVLALMASSINNAMPVKPAATLSQLNGMSGSAYPDGTVAVLTATSGGLTQGALFTRIGTGWNLVSGTQCDATAFAASLASLTALYTMPGATFYNTVNGEFGIWQNASGGYRTIVDQAWKTIAYPGGVKGRSTGYALAYKIVPGGVVLRGGVQKSSGNFANGALLFTLPAEARPAAGTQAVVSGTSWSIANIQINADGTVKLYAIMNVNSPWFSLDGVFIPND